MKIEKISFHHSSLRNINRIQVRLTFSLERKKLDSDA